MNILPATVRILCLLFLFSSVALGQDQAVTATGAANNAWMLTCSALVLFMTAPGLAMFYGGLVRHKNVLSVMMQCMFLMGLMTVIWALWGYSLAFGGDPGEPIQSVDWHTQYLFMQNVQRSWDETNAGSRFRSSMRTRNSRG